MTLNQNTGKRGRTIKKALIPDGYFCIDDEEYEYFNFVEVDRGNESVNPSKPYLSNLATKIKLYMAYYLSGQYQRKFGNNSMRVLFVVQGKRGTSGEKRLQNVKEIAEQLGAGQQFWFTTLERTKNPRTVLTQPIWQKAGEQDEYSLIW